MLKKEIQKTLCEQSKLLEIFKKICELSPEQQQEAIQKALQLLAER